MARTVTLREANQHFAKYVREVESGEEFVVTRRGRPVARLAPVDARRTLTAAQQAARRRTVRRLRKGWPLGIGRLDRDSLHER